MTLFMEKNDEVISTSADVLLSYNLRLNTLLAEGPFFFVAVPRNMELFDVASTNVYGQTVMKHIQSAKNGGSLYCAFNAHCAFMWTHQCACIAH